MSLIGRYVRTFAEASHALPDGMHLNADYPFMLPSIVKIEKRGGETVVTVSNGCKEAEIVVTLRGLDEVAYLEQSSTFERMFGRKPTRFKMMPFKDDRTPAIGQPASPPDKAQLENPGPQEINT